MAQPTGLVAIGVEEEFHTIDLETRRLIPRADSLLAQLPRKRFGTELQRSVVETNSRPYVRLIDLAEDLAALRRGVVAAAEGLGMGIVAAGTVPVADLDSLKVTPDPRYENMLDEYQLLAREQLICGTQVHVDVRDRDMAVAVANRVTPWLPALLALSASSPYWLGLDTGYASYRTLLWSRWPTTGPLGAFGSAAEYDEMIADLVRSGVISDPGMIYYDVRPSAHLPTLELRIADACPRVEDVVLLAGLFRAIVVEEINAMLDGRPASPIRAEVVRAATWRAARSGLEGELVDPADGTPVPARQLLRRLLERQRPRLEEAGDWELVTELTEAAVERGSSAARQRQAFARGGLTEVVDMLVAETRANTDWVPGAGPERRAVTEMLSGYDASCDEAIVFDGSARGPYGLVLTALDRIGADGLREREQQRDEVQRGLGMTFHFDGEDDRLFPFDLVPRVVAAEDWDFLRTGLVQRVRALEAFLRDAYGAREAIRDGVLPAWTVDDSPGLHPAGYQVPAGVVRCAVAGIDLVSDGAGRWTVLEDNLRVPSGIGYAMANRWLAARVLPELVLAAHTASPARAVALLKSALTATSGEAALITIGPDDSAFFEHRLLADEMGIPLVRPGELTADADGVRTSGGDPLRVLYRRIDEDELFGADGADGRPLGPGLLAAVESGALRLANAPGNGVADDKALYAYVPRLVEYYLGERPLLANVPTYLCRDAEQRAEVLDRLEELVAKPVDGYGGKGVVIGPDASRGELDEVRTLIKAEPDRWVAQETVRLSTHPTLVKGGLEPRAVDLRVFVCTGDEPVVVPMALTRVAPAGSRIVNSSQGGGSKDTWLMQ
ncbi:carboxylate--amine ligase/circularly permuted type 2 ATP-grasp protein [Actinomadura sp. DC4]|uniref:carboxylate--amine ligase/circularly permuted type 2 ATP-grasp protein n=1 Tax=Actinomadura sp. DC4 TaxID=3055069 RepID=UPI0025B252FF|nr:carboxylate--amine ligase/circularly permuted type 2 ATP-grasp protein [Actinomadura sp. DC4]MDN3353789.1 carboxylate--amine ligase/circularly permuted type 2 ATP-grasp protein [Actinomadura sp. DC4]